MKKLEIITERLVIRQMKDSDLEPFHLYRCNPEIAKYQGFDVMNQVESMEFIQRQKDKMFGKPGEWVQYAIESKSEQLLIGDCAIKLDEYDERIAEVGMTISHLHHQKGYAREALKGILGFLFDEKQVHRVVETVDAENEASIRLLKSVGFRMEGHFIENIFFKGKWGSEFQYAMLRREWNQMKQTMNSK